MSTPADPFEVVRSRLEETVGQGRLVGGQWRFRCPAHNDLKPSLTVDTGKDGRVLLRCHAGCETEAITDALSLTVADLFPPRADAGRDRGEWTPAGQAVAIYSYTDSGGVLLFQVCRTADKQFRQRRPDPTAKTGWRWNLAGVTRVLYRLPQVLAAIGHGQTVYLVEGEKDADALDRAGVIATTASGGADNLHLTDLSVLADAAVIAVVDRDEAGAIWANKVIERVPHAKLVQAKVGKDAADHLAAGHNPDEFEPYATGEPEQDIGQSAGLIDWQVLIATDFGDRPWLTKPLIQPGGQIALIGSGKSGKSLFAFEWAIRACAGLPFLGHSSSGPLRGLYVDQENPHPELQRRLWAMGYDQRPDLLVNLHYASFPQLGPLDTPMGAALLIALVQQIEPDIVWLDTISRMIAGKENDADTWLALYRLTLVPLKALGVSVVRLDHFGKDLERGSRGSSAKTQDVDDVWELSPQPGGLIKLLRTHTRSGLGEGEIWLRREGNSSERGTTAHVLTTPEQIAASQAKGDLWLVQARVCAALDAAGLPKTQDVGYGTANSVLKDKTGKGMRKEALLPILAMWRSQPDRNWAQAIAEATGEPPWMVS